MNESMFAEMLSHCLAFFMTCAQICIHDRIFTVMLHSRLAGFWVLTVGGSIV